MNNDILCKIVSNMDKCSDVANLSVAICDQSTIRLRKKQEYDRILKIKMQHFWYGRLAVLLHTHRHTYFWDQFVPRVFAINDHVRHQFASYFRGWDVSVCGRKLYMSTRVIDEVISVTVDLHAPHHSIRENDPFAFKFDITHMSTHIDVDSYKPRGKYSSVLSAMYEALREKSEQRGVYSHYQGVVWEKFVSWGEMEEVFKKCLADDWECEDGLYYNIDGVGESSVYCKVQLSSWSIKLRTKHSLCWLRPVSGSISYNGSQPSTNRGFRGSLDRKLFRILQEFNEFGNIFPCNLTFPIHIKLHGERHVFPTWSELSRLSGISMMTLRKLSTLLPRGVFIDFDTNTYRRKRISFKV
jgi:hypothetical protein